MDTLRDIFPEDEQYDRFKQTEVEALVFSFEDLGELPITASKAGGIGYLPKAEAYPTNAEGQPLTLLAQINFAEMPSLTPYPETGILAFYVDGFDDLIGLDFDQPTNTSGFRVLYFEEITAEAYSQAEIVALFAPYDDEEQFTVVDTELKMTGTIEKRYLSRDSYDFKNVYGVDYYEYFEEQFGDAADDVMDALFELDHHSGSQMGGYPFFTQEDPRKYADEVTHTELLFQLDTDQSGIMWGDSGVGNFFISKPDLELRDFSNVMYNWDCY
ncbi:YwqG family protein [Enterococcus olivae]